jgi:hypothetical protein
MCNFTFCIYCCFTDFNFGVRQSGDRVNDVELPPWSHCDARRFVLIQRQALESAHARENLPHWIDLVFGYKQTGKAAVEAINVFHPAVYYHFVCFYSEMLVKKKYYAFILTEYLLVPVWLCS